MPHPDANEFAEDAWPRTPIVEQEAMPANWKLVKLHIKQAQTASDVEDKDSSIVAATKYHLEQATFHLQPPFPE